MSINRKDVASILIFVALILAFVLLINNITSKNNGRELQIVRDAVKNAALTCYAVEGMYPDDLSYLRDHYNLSYNEEKYHVFYEPLASNLMPSIKVAERGGKTDKQPSLSCPTPPVSSRASLYCCFCPCSPA